MPEEFREQFVELGEAIIVREPHVQPIDMLRMAAAGELVDLPHTLHGHLLLDLDLDEPVRILECGWTTIEGVRFSAVWGLATLDGIEEPVAVHWHGPTDAYDAAVFEAETIVVQSTVDLAGLIASIEQAAFGELLADAS
jgi:hypothetical protein